MEGYIAGLREKKKHILDGIIGSVGSWVNSGIQAGINAWNVSKQESMNEKNWENQKKMNELARQWQLEDQAHLEEREDTEVQRRMKDLEAAGINPLLAAGGESGSGMMPTAGVGYTPGTAAQMGGIELPEGAGLKAAYDLVKEKKEIAGLTKDEAKKELDIAEAKTKAKYAEKMFQTQLMKTGVDYSNARQIGRKMILDYSGEVSEQERKRALDVWDKKLRSWAESDRTKDIIRRDNEDQWAEERRNHEREVTEAWEREEYEDYRNWKKFEEGNKVLAMFGEVIQLLLGMKGLRGGRR